jgi:hypothetical protein
MHQHRPTFPTLGKHFAYRKEILTAQMHGRIPRFEAGASPRPLPLWFSIERGIWAFPALLASPRGGTLLPCESAYRKPVTVLQELWGFGMQVYGDITSPVGMSALTRTTGCGSATVTRTPNKQSGWPHPLSCGGRPQPLHRERSLPGSAQDSRSPVRPSRSPRTCGFTASGRACEPVSQAGEDTRAVALDQHS